MSRKSRKNVGLIGLGIIGARAAAGLRAAGYHVFVWNRTPKPVANFLGSPAEVADICEVIQLFVADSQAVFEIIEALGDSLTEKHIVMCSATIGPEAVLEAARLVEEKGAKFLDVPFTGSRIAAERSQLVYYIGGDESVYLRAKPVLEATSKAIVRCGKIGDAATLKVVTNMITAVTTQTLAEALAITRRAGIGPDVFAAALEQNACRSGVLELKLPKMVTGDYEPHFSLKHMFKDVQLGIHLANSLDLEVPATTVTAGVLYGAMNSGWADLDFASVFKLYEGQFAKLAKAAELAAPPVEEPKAIEAKAVEPEPVEVVAEPVVEEAAKIAPAVEATPAPESEKPAEAPVEIVAAVAPAEEAKSDEPKAEAAKVEDAKPVEPQAEAAKESTDEKAPAKPEGGESPAEEPKPARPFNRIIRRFFSPVGK